MSHKLSHRIVFFSWIINKTLQELDMDVWLNKECDPIIKTNLALLGKSWAGAILSILRINKQFIQNLRYCFVYLWDLYEDSWTMDVTYGSMLPEIRKRYIKRVRSMRLRGTVRDQRCWIRKQLWTWMKDSRRKPQNGTEVPWKLKNALVRSISYSKGVMKRWSLLIWLASFGTH